MLQYQIIWYEIKLENKKDLEFDYIDNIFTKIQGNSHFYWFIAFPVGFAYWYNYSRLLPFLVLMPKLLWSFNGGSDWISWTEEEAWSNSNTLYQVDYSSEGTITNWITELNLAWLSKFSIWLFGSLYNCLKTFSRLFTK